MVTIYGYAEIGNSKYVFYKDPWPPDCEKADGVCHFVFGGKDAVMTYEAFVSDATHNWGNSFYKFKYTGP
ncbi:MAG: hypothetical protein LWW94_10330 [Candidatus Desulfofervidaceae bacterium]|nr:hypothetical protein [Candidatus Desulfofervidaceae bacterium]